MARQECAKSKTRAYSALVILSSLIFLGCDHSVGMQALRGIALVPGASLAVADVQRVGMMPIYMVTEALRSLLPGVVLGIGSYTLYSRHRELPTRKLRAGCALLILTAVYAVPWRSLGRVPDSRPSAEQRVNAVLSGVLSGEEVMVGESFARLADPGKPLGNPPDQGWQRNLLSHITEAIRAEDSQVALVFSRQGCPWCDRQLPVLRNAIMERSGEKALEFDEVSEFASPEGDSLSIANRTLRVFVLDADEFPMVAQQFEVDAFPATMVFGLRGGTPLMARGLLDDKTFKDMLLAAAAGFMPDTGHPKRRRGIFR